MSGVVLRCRACGTTQDHPGECDVCSAGPVTYFCGNHGAGLWLSGPICEECGAQFGDTPAKPIAPSTSRSPSIPRSATRPSTSRPATDGMRPPSVRRVPRPSAPPAPGSGMAGDTDTDTPSLADLIVEMAEEGRRVRGTAIETPPVLPRAPRVGVPILGCLFRLVLLLVFLGVLAALAVATLLNGVF